MCMTQENTCFNVESDADCERWASDAQCEINPEWMYPNCRKTCLRCDRGTCEYSPPLSISTVDVSNCRKNCLGCDRGTCEYSSFCLSLHRGCPPTVERPVWGLIEELVSIHPPIHCFLPLTFYLPLIFHNLSRYEFRNHRHNVINDCQIKIVKIALWKLEFWTFIQRNPGLTRSILSL